MSAERYGGEIIENNGKSNRSRGTVVMQYKGTLLMLNLTDTQLAPPLNQAQSKADLCQQSSICPLSVIRLLLLENSTE